MTEAERSWRDLCALDHAVVRIPTPRIDSMRNRLAATRQLMAMLEDELEDLHVLAYERQRLTSERVRGGEPDYALDNHGDPRARSAYREIGTATVHALEVIADAHHTALQLLRSGERGRNPTRKVKAEELAAALETQARRAARGEYTPGRREAQPDAALAQQAVAELIRERDRYKELSERYERRLAAHETPTHAKNGRRGWRSA